MAQTRHLGLGVIETRWFDERHHTVRPLFEFLSYALKDRPDAFTYERFVGAVSFREAVRFMMGGGDIEYLYVAAHGDFGKIEAPDGSGLSRTFIRNTICEINRRKRRLKGVLFGSCKFGDAHNLIEIMRPQKIRGADRAEPPDLGGGYGQEIDYTRSSLFDIYFFDLLFRTSGRERDRAPGDDAGAAEPGAAGPGREPVAAASSAKLPNGQYRDITAQKVVDD